MLITEGRPLDAAAARARPRPCPATSPGARPATRGFAIRQTRRGWRRSSRSCACAGTGVHGARVRGLIVVLWRAGLRIAEGLSLGEGDLDQGRGAILGRFGKGGRRREVGMDEWGWEQLRPWLEHRARMPIGALFCVVNGPARGRAWSRTAARA
jgi:integrase